MQRRHGTASTLGLVIVIIFTCALLFCSRHVQAMQPLEFYVHNNNNNMYEQFTSQQQVNPTGSTCAQCQVCTKFSVPALANFAHTLSFSDTYGLVAVDAEKPEYALQLFGYDMPSALRSFASPEGVISITEPLFNPVVLSKQAAFESSFRPILAYISNTTLKSAVLNAIKTEKIIELQTTESVAAILTGQFSAIVWNNIRAQYIANVKIIAISRFHVFLALRDGSVLMSDTVTHLFNFQNITSYFDTTNTIEQIDTHQHLNVTFFRDSFGYVYVMGKYEL